MATTATTCFHAFTHPILTLYVATEAMLGNPQVAGNGPGTCLPA
jgi:hypothetical protein